MRKYRYETVAGIFVVIGLLCVGYMTVKLGKINLFGEDTYTLYARFTSVSGLRVGNPVEMLGLEIGRVQSLILDQKDQLAVAELKIKRGVNVYGDAIASIKTAGLMKARPASHHGVTFAQRSCSPSHSRPDSFRRPPLPS